MKKKKNNNIKKHETMTIQEQPKPAPAVVAEPQPPKPAINEELMAAIIEKEVAKKIAEWEAQHSQKPTATKEVAPKQTLIAKPSKVSEPKKLGPTKDVKQHSEENKRPKKKIKFMLGLTRFFKNIKTVFGIFINDILHEPKSAESLRSPTGKEARFRFVHKWTDKSKKLWKRFWWRVYEDICESFWKFFAYQIAILALLGYIPLVLKYLNYL